MSEIICFFNLRDDQNDKSLMFIRDFRTGEWGMGARLDDKQLNADSWKVTSPVEANWNSM